MTNSTQHCSCLTNAGLCEGRAGHLHIWLFSESCHGFESSLLCGRNYPMCFSWLDTSMGDQAGHMHFTLSALVFPLNWILLWKCSSMHTNRTVWGTPMPLSLTSNSKWQCALKHAPACSCRQVSGQAAQPPLVCTCVLRKLCLTHQHPQGTSNCIWIVNTSFAWGNKRSSKANKARMASKIVTFLIFQGRLLSSLNLLGHKYRQRYNLWLNTRICFLYNYMP